ncbi:Os08g0333233 [Oryza sativa Japonica Group]|uniref:Os08g0333233 protein n=1 Tax=Oryza sativa subsp. japonica TaxID=39947 RepID=A0A0P0XEM9_ORYSJ|nr:hypothetical protein EE612_043546 [Oryza sativa]BAT04949.1 Os08g0333233 [Oryza sativa Japonica Group]
MFWNLNERSSESSLPLSTISGPSPSKATSSVDSSAASPPPSSSPCTIICTVGLAAAPPLMTAAGGRRSHMRKWRVTGRSAWRCSDSRWLSETVSKQRMSPAVEVAQGSTLSSPTRETTRSFDARRARRYSSRSPDRVDATPGVLSSATDDTICYLFSAADGKTQPGVARLQFDLQCHLPCKRSIP